MYSKTLALALALTSAVAASPLDKRQSTDPCQVKYNECIASGVPEIACQCDITACLGEDSARLRAACASATSTIVRSSTASKPTPTSTESCTPYSSATSTAAASFSSISGIPGGCNPAHPGSCPTPTAQPSISVPVPSSAAYSSPTKTDQTWSLTNLTRYCGEGNTGCDYNFAITADGKTERCTVIRMPGANAATESWSNQPCTSGSAYSVSWGYVAEPAPAFAVVTVVKGKELSWFGVADVNGQKVTVTPSNPFGSGQYPDSTSPVYTY